jgi:phenylacetate-CoA ligase
LSAVLAGRSPCGRTNTRIKGWMGRADQTAKVKGMFVRPEQIAEVAKRIPSSSRAAHRDARRRAGRDDLAGGMRVPAAGISGRSARALQSVTKLKGAVKLVAPGTLPNDGKVIADERPVG